MKLFVVLTGYPEAGFAFFQAWEIYPPSECSRLRERNLSVPLPIHRSDEFRSAIPRQVARQQSLLPLRRPLPMLKIACLAVKRTVQPHLPEAVARA
jgi:hypothetical protein